MLRGVLRDRAAYISLHHSGTVRYLRVTIGPDVGLGHDLSLDIGPVLALRGSRAVVFLVPESHVERYLRRGILIEHSSCYFLRIGAHLTFPYTARM